MMMTDIISGRLFYYIAIAIYTIANLPFDKRNRKLFFKYVRYVHAYYL